MQRLADLGCFWVTKGLGTAGRPLERWERFALPQKFGRVGKMRKKIKHTRMKKHEDELKKKQASFDGHSSLVGTYEQSGKIAQQQGRIPSQWRTAGVVMGQTAGRSTPADDGGSDTPL
jgi:hypothetical protein